MHHDDDDNVNDDNVDDNDDDGVGLRTDIEEGEGWGRFCRLGGVLLKKCKGAAALSKPVVAVLEKKKTKKCSAQTFGTCELVLVLTQ